MTALQGLINPDLTEALEVVSEALMTTLRVALPGCITIYDETTHKATVQPLLMKRDIDDTATPTPLSPIPNVPIMFPRTSKGALILPLAVGDPVTLLFSDRGLDQWKVSTGDAPVEPNSTRKHTLSDCWAIPGGYPDGKPFAAASPGNLALQVQPGTKIYIGDGSIELLKLLDNIIDLFEVTATGLFATYALHGHSGAGAGPPSDAAAWNAALVKLSLIRADLQSLGDI